MLLLYVMWCVVGNDVGAVDVCIRVYVCVVCVDCVVGGCDVADDGCYVAGGDGVCYRVADRCVGADVDVECVGGDCVANAAVDVVVDV